MPVRSASLVRHARSEVTPVRARLDSASLRPGDVLLFGVFERECDERLCSDVVSLLNVLGAAVLPERYAGVPAAWACHAAICVGERRIVHATGPETTFLLAVDDVDRYLAEHSRLCTVFRADDSALAARAADVALALAKVEGAERRYSAAALLVQLGLQAVFPGRCDAVLDAQLRAAAERNTSCFDNTAGLVSCSSFVSTVLHMSAASGDAQLGFPRDLSPFDLYVELLDHRAWSVVSVVRPEALRSTALPDASVERASHAHTAIERAIPFVAALIAGACVAMVFALGWGRALHRRVFGSSVVRRDALALEASSR